MPEPVQPLSPEEIEDLKGFLRVQGLLILAREDELRRWKKVLDHADAFGCFYDPTGYQRHGETVGRWRELAGDYLAFCGKLRKVVEADVEILARKR